MANTLKKIFIPGLDQVAQTYTVESWHVSQSVDALTGIEAYDITISGSLVLTGSLAINGLTDPALTDVLTIDTTTGQIYYTSSTAIAPINNYISSTVTNTYTSSTVNNNYGTSSIINNYTASTVNNPGGLDTEIQYNSGSAFGASPSFRYDYTIESLAQGNNVLASGNYSHAQGNDVTASANFSHAEGILTKANGVGSHAEGSSTTATGGSSHAEGEETTAQGTAAHAEGFETLASGDYSHAEGILTSASNDYAHSEGDNTVASGPSSHAEGYQTVASNNWSHAEGYQTVASGQASHAEGRQNLASGDYSHTQGTQNTSSGNYSFTAGLQNKATNTYTFAAGLQNIVSGNSSAAFGYLNNVSGQSAFSLGNFNSASGQYSFASGYRTKAQGFASFTSGYFTSASGDYQIVVGAFNETSNTSSYAFIVGGGTGTALITQKNLIFASGSQFQLSGSFAPQYRSIGNIQVAPGSSGVAVTNRDYNVGFDASNVTVVGQVNRIQLPSNVPVGTVIYLQRVGGQTFAFNSASTIQVSGSSGHLINGSAGYEFPTTIYVRRMFVFSGATTGWYAEGTSFI
jgi:hypothetical protein